MPQIKDKILLKKIAFEIQKLRKLQNITQEVMYFDTNIHIGRIEQGENNISISTLKHICKYLNISLSDFFNNLNE